MNAKKAYGETVRVVTGRGSIVHCLPLSLARPGPGSLGGPGRDKG